MPSIFSSVLFFRKPSCSDDVTGSGPREGPILYLSMPVLILNKTLILNSTEM